VHPDYVGRIVSFIVVSFALLASPAAQPSVNVRWSEDRLSVQASRAVVASVLSEVARHTNIRIQGLEKATGTFDVEFADKSLLQGLQILLEDFNYVIVLGEPFTVWIHSRIASAGSVPGGLERRTSPLDDSAQLPLEDERNEEQEERLEAARQLKDASPESLLQVVRPGWTTGARIAALHALAERHPADAAEAAAAAIDDPEPALSGAAMQILSEIEHPKAVETIGATLQHPNLAVRRAALELLFARSHPESLPYVRLIIDDPDASMRARARELMKLLEQSSKEE
jgi:HEAT repeats